MATPTEPDVRSPAASITALVLAKNEEKHLPRLLQSLHWVDETVVVDDDSTDRTAAIARDFGAKVLTHKLEDFSSQWNVGLGLASGAWVFCLDADEEVPDECVALLRHAVQTAAPDIGGFRILRRNYALGRWLRHGQQFGKLVHWYDVTRRLRGFRPGDILGGGVKLFRREGASFQNLVHEEVRTSGRIVQLQAFINHYTADSIQDMFDKVNFYTTLHAQQLYRQHPQRPPRGYWRRLLWTPLKTFFGYYLRKRGFLDGFPGLARAYASGYYELLKCLKLYELYHRTTT